MVMDISAVSSSRGGASIAINEDLQVKTLKGKIEDWSTCPTTDPQTKRAIVGRLQAQLDALTSSLQSNAGVKGPQKVGPEPVKIPGLGETVDLSV